MLNEIFPIKKASIRANWRTRISTPDLTIQTRRCRPPPVVGDEIMIWDARRTARKWIRVVAGTMKGPSHVCGKMENCGIMFCENPCQRRNKNRGKRQNQSQVSRSVLKAMDSLIRHLPKRKLLINFTEMEVASLASAWVSLDTSRRMPVAPSGLGSLSVGMGCSRLAKWLMNRRKQRRESNRTKLKPFRINTLPKQCVMQLKNYALKLTKK